MLNLVQGPRQNKFCRLLKYLDLMVKVHYSGIITWDNKDILGIELFRFSKGQYFMHHFTSSFKSPFKDSGSQRKRLKGFVR